MVVSVSVVQLLKVGIYVLSDRFGRRIEVEGRSGRNVGYLAGGHKGIVHGSHLYGVNPQQVVHCRNYQLATSLKHQNSAFICAFILFRAHAYYFCHVNRDFPAAVREKNPFIIIHLVFPSDSPVRLSVIIKNAAVYGNQDEYQ